MWSLHLSFHKYCWKTIIETGFFISTIMTQKYHYSKKKCLVSWNGNCQRSIICFVLKKMCYFRIGFFATGRVRGLICTGCSPSSTTLIISKIVSHRKNLCRQKLCGIERAHNYPGHFKVRVFFFQMETLYVSLQKREIRKVSQRAMCMSYKFPGTPRLF